jgi:hypothetical protein
MGRFPRSVEMITHRPVIGSFRNSGKARPPELETLYRQKDTLQPLYSTLPQPLWKRCPPGVVCGSVGQSLPAFTSRMWLQSTEHQRRRRGTFRSALTWDTENVSPPFGGPPAAYAGRRSEEFLRNAFKADKLKRRSPEALLLCASEPPAGVLEFRRSRRHRIARDTDEHGAPAGSIQPFALRSHASLCRCSFSGMQASRASLTVCALPRSLEFRHRSRSSPARLWRWMECSFRATKM